MHTEQEPQELDQFIIDRALAVSAEGSATPVSRAVIDGAVVIYNTDDPPLWLRPVLAARDEDGSPRDAMHVRASDEDGTPILVEYSVGSAITGTAWRDVG